MTRNPTTQTDWTLSNRLTKILDDFMETQEGVKANYWGQQPVDDAIADIKALIKDFLSRHQKRLVERVETKLDEEKFYFYEACQMYRHTPVTDQAIVIARFEALKGLILSLLKGEK
jgi:hypothetical protein